MLLSWRKKKIAENAREHLEPGEEIRAMVMTQTGKTAAQTAVSAAGAQTSAARAAGTLGRARQQMKEDRAVTGEEAAASDASTAFGRVHALAVTDDHLYSLYIPSFTGVAGVREKRPLAEADLEVEGKTIRLGGVEYNVLFLAGKDAAAVAERVAAARG